MTKERPITFGLGDIASMGIRCSKCSSELSVIPNSERRSAMPECCPLCNCEWSASEGCLEPQLIRKIETIQGAGTRPVSILFELNDDGPECLRDLSSRPRKG